jgi:hypothetical protein
MVSINKKAEPKDSSFGSSAIFSKDPPLSVPLSQMVWLYRVFNIYINSINSKEQFLCQVFTIFISPYNYAVSLQLHSFTQSKKWKRFTQKTRIPSLKNEEVL